MIIDAVADTHTALWYLFGDARLSPDAKVFIDDSAQNRHKVAVSSISLAELVYLVEKNRLHAVAYTELVQAMNDPEHVFAEAVFTSAIVEAMRGINRDEIPDMPDRMIAATAVYFSVPVISRDRRIRTANLKTVW